VGRERSWARKHLHLCTACLIIVLLGACAPVNTMLAEQKNRAHLQRMHHLMIQGDFEEALHKNQEVLALSPKDPPGDAALFGMGLLHVHGANPEKDYEKARSFFTRMEKEFPQSPLAAEARVWAGVLETGETGAERKSRAHLQSVQNLMRRGDFEGALLANQEVLAATPKVPPGDAALFSMGLMHIHYANPRKDYRRALGVFAQLQKDFPQSPLAEDAKVWVGVLEAMERAIQIDIEIEEKRKELTR
jgi:TolA-binding protein